jgi:hypothetical protein
MEIPEIDFWDAEKQWPETAIKTNGEVEKNHPEREKRFLQNTVKDPVKLKKVIRAFQYYTWLYYEILDHILLSLRCRYFYWRTVIGCEDAALTGQITGLVWFIKELYLTRLRRKDALSKELKWEVLPAFGQNYLSVNFECIFTITLGNVINVAKNTYIKKLQRRDRNHG